MYIPQKIKTLIWLVLIAIALFGAYQIPAVRTLVNRTAAKQGIDIDKNSPEAQIRRLKGSYDDRDDSETLTAKCSNSAITAKSSPPTPAARRATAMCASKRAAIPTKPTNAATAKAAVID